MNIGSGCRARLRRNRDTDNGIKWHSTIDVNPDFCFTVEQNMNRTKRSDLEQKRFRELAILCGVRLDKLFKRKRRGYRERPIKAFT